ncbi:non-ribosomal peptide synthetase [Ornithinibacillus scapharcae]|uniref:non-ribosomal peptide synthetase n=1 Tax=Ornithinibacillus scapharcae TaxID=1147159 RepID=UPI000225ABA0|nr:non-ribosomal peptide synthetase [Ornithinibacillus scapharcae]
MKDIYKQLHEWPKEKVELLKQMLEEQGIDIEREVILPLDQQVKEVPVSFAQQRLFILDQLNPGNPAYNMPARSRVKGSFKPENFIQSLNLLIKRHESLRTIFRFSEQREPIQIVLDELQLDVPIISLTKDHLEEKENKVEKLLYEDTNECFNLQKGPLLRCKIVHYDKEEYLILFNIHHIISDARSLEVLYKELWTIYESLQNKKDHSLPKLPIQYSDYAAWQHRISTNGKMKEQEHYWKKKLAGQHEKLELPADQQRPKDNTFKGGYYQSHLSTTLNDKVKLFCRRKRLTPYMFFMTTFFVLLHKLTGKDEIAIGTPFANRDRVETENLIGFFINTLVMKVDIEESLTFEEVLERVRDVSLEAYENKDIPFEKVVELVNPERDSDQMPLFQVMFNFVKLNQLNHTQSGLTIEPLNGNYEAIYTKFDVTLYTFETETGFKLNMLYNADLYSKSRIMEYINQFHLIIEQVIENPTILLSDISLLTQEMRTKVENPTKLLKREDQSSIISGFLNQCKRQPDYPAIHYGNQEISYDQLDKISNKVANYLAQQGILKGDHVVIVSQRSPELIYSLIGILKVGASFTILDSIHPEAVLEKQLRSIEYQGIIDLSMDYKSQKFTEQKIQGSLKAQLFSLNHVLNHYSDDSFLVKISGDDRAYFSLTSGTTGEPKVIQGTHGPVTHFIKWYISKYNMANDDRFSMLSGLSHDPLLRDIFVALWVGGTVCIPHFDHSKEPDKLHEWIEEKKIQVIHLTPGLFSILQVAKSQTSLENVRLLGVGGESWTFSEAEKMKEKFPGATIINFYGTTETPQVMGIYELDHVHLGKREVVPIERGIEDVQLLILTMNGKQAGLGEIGELVIRTPYLTDGYIDQALTDQKYISNPFTNNLNDRLYRTGDKARYHIDGKIEIIGRWDEQVKIRGYRVEIPEIEKALISFNKVQKSAVKVAEIGNSHELYAYVQVDDPESVAALEIQHHIEGLLPHYAVPQKIIVLKQLPLNRNGKVDKKSLPVFGEIQDNEHREFTPPSTDLEKRIAQLWQELLNVKKVGLNDHFFALGGHSLLATQLILLIKETIGVTIPLKAIFEGPTLRQLIEIIEQQEEGSTNNGTYLNKDQSIKRVEDNPNGYPLSFNQQRLWFLNQLYPEQTSYHMYSAIKLTGSLNEMALEKSISDIIMRHESLRTNFIYSKKDDMPLQVIHREREISIQKHSLVNEKEVDQENKIRNIAEDAILANFDLEKDSLLRVVIIQKSELEHLLLIVMHHIISDAWSVGVFNKELVELYNFYHDGVESPLQELNIQYRDFANWQQQSINRDSYQSDLAYWEENLYGLEPVELPTDYPRKVSLEDRGDRVYLRFSKEMTEKLVQLSDANESTIYMTMLSILNLLVYRYTGSNDISIGSPIANRTLKELNPLIGFFVNTLVMRSEVLPSMTFSDLLKQVRGTSLEAFEHQQTPFEAIVDRLQPNRHLNQTPLFRIGYVHQNTPMEKVELSGLTIQGVELPIYSAKFDTMFISWNSNDQLCLAIEYNTSLYRRSTIERMSSHIYQLIHSVIDAPNTPLSAIPMLTESEREILLHKWNDTEELLDYRRSIIEYFEEQVRKTPFHRALKYEGKALKYEELNERSNQLAYYLMKKGVKPGDYVGISMYRSIEMIVSLLGILKTGAAYVPLDPDFPKDRINHMIKDTNMEIVLVHPDTKKVFEGTGMSINLVDLVQQKPELYQMEKVNPSVQLDQESVAYVLYTSGSTGKPKGVEVKHTGVSNRLLWMQRYFQLQDYDCVLQKTPYSFDVSVWEFFWPLMTGATLVMAKRDGHRDPEYLQRIIMEESITTIHFVPSMLAQFLEFGDISQCHTLERIICSGEELTNELQQLFFHKRSSEGQELYNLYGPTEASIDVSYWKCLPGQEANKVPIGKPISNIQLYILDSNKQLVPIGVPGELYIGGIGLAKGYLNLPIQTQEKFLENPFNPNSLLYATGDLVKYMEDGNIVYLGRIDHQVKVNGNRIELGEIEAVITSHLDVKQTVVTTIPSDTGVRLVGYVVLQKEERIISNLDELKTFALTKLPTYMVPNLLIELESLPLSSNGKVDRKQLPIPDVKQLMSKEDYIQPRTEEEKVIASIWSEVLGVENVGVNDSFFALGGDSIKSIQVVYKIRDHDYQISVEDIFQYDSLDELAKQLKNVKVVNQESKTSDTFSLISDEDLNKLFQS